jgi:hypothetical protein
MLERTEWLDHIVDARPVKSDEMDAASQSYAIGARDDFAYYRLLAIACLPASSCDAQASRDTDPREAGNGRMCRWGNSAPFRRKRQRVKGKAAGSDRVARGRSSAVPR